MGSYANALSFLLSVIVLLTALKAEAREMKYFSDLNPQEEQRPLKPSPEIKNYNGYHFETRQIDIPTEEFIANINKDSWENNGFPHNYDENSYVTVPQGNKEKDSNDFYYPRKLEPTVGMHNTDASANNEFELTPGEKTFFNEKERMNAYPSFNKERENVHSKEAQGMSDTRTLENGKFYYNPTRDHRASGKFNEYIENSEYKSKYNEFRHLEDFEFNPQNQAGFVP